MEWFLSYAVALIIFVYFYASWTRIKAQERQALLDEMYSINKKLDSLTTAIDGMACAVDQVEKEIKAIRRN